MISTGAIIMLLGILFLCLFLGVPIGFSLGLSGVATILFVAGDQFMIQIPITLYKSLSEFVFVAIPLFVLMGEILFHGKSGERIFMATHLWLQKIKGGTAVASVSAFTFFAAIVGSSMTSVMTIGKIAVPEMLKQNYSKKLTYGLAVVGGSLGILIPPSIPMILYASLSGTSPGKLFIAGIIPGFLIALLLSLYAMWKAPKVGEINPIHVSLAKENAVSSDDLAANSGYRFIKAPKLASLSANGNSLTLGNSEISKTVKSKRNITVKAIPDLLLPVIVLGGIYAGIFTPTEAAGVGVIYAVIVSFFIHRSLDLKLLPKVLVDSVTTTTKLLTVVVGALVFGSALTLIGLPQYLTAIIGDLAVSPWVILLVMNVTWLLMGFFLEVVSIILITTPIFFPIAMALGFDPIWFGIIMVLNLELAVLTPPVGMNLFALKSLVPDESMGTIIRSVLPFTFLVVFVLILVWVFPQLALVLVN